MVGIEPTLREEHDFESCASANSATPAYFYFYIGCREPESNRYGSHLPQDFKSCASASSATPAHLYAKNNIQLWRRQPDSNRWIKVLQTFALPLGYAADINNGAEDGIRTRDPHLGKVVFYH